MIRVRFDYDYLDATICFKTQKYSASTNNTIAFSFTFKVPLKENVSFFVIMKWKDFETGPKH